MATCRLHMYGQVLLRLKELNGFPDIQCTRQCFGSWPEQSAQLAEHSCTHEQPLHSHDDYDYTSTAGTTDSHTILMDYAIKPLCPCVAMLVFHQGPQVRLAKLTCEHGSYCSNVCKTLTVQALCLASAKLLELCFRLRAEPSSSRVHGGLTEITQKTRQHMSDSVWRRSDTERPADLPANLRGRCHK